MKKHFIKSHWWLWLTIIVVFVLAGGILLWIQYSHTHITKGGATEFVEDMMSLYGYDSDLTSIRFRDFETTKEGMPDGYIKIHTTFELNSGGGQEGKELTFCYDEENNIYEMSPGSGGLAREDNTDKNLLLIICCLLASLPFLGVLIFLKRWSGKELQLGKQLCLQGLLYIIVLNIYELINYIIYYVCGMTAPELFYYFGIPGVGIVIVLLYATWEEIIKCLVPFVATGRYKCVTQTEMYWTYGIISATFFSVTEQILKLQEIPSYNLIDGVQSIICIFPSHLVFTSMTLLGYELYKRKGKRSWAIAGFATAAVLHTIHNCVSFFIEFYYVEYEQYLKWPMAVVYYIVLFLLFRRFYKKRKASVNSEVSEQEETNKV